MTNPPNTEGLAAGRIDGEFYYATWGGDEFYSDGTFEIHRQSDGAEIVKWFHGPDGPQPDAESALKAFDGEARRHIDTERERAAATMDESLRAFHRHFMLEVATLFEIDKPAARRFKALAQEFFEAAIAPHESNQEGAG